MSLDNHYYHHPQPAARLAADDVLLHLDRHKTWRTLFEQGKMLGVLVVEPPTTQHSTVNQPESADLQQQPIPSSSSFLARVHYINNIYYLAAYSGVINGLTDEDHFFVPPIYDLQNPDDFYLQRDAEISALNRELANLQIPEGASKAEIRRIKAQQQEITQRRKCMSLELQREIFRHFNFCDSALHYRNIIDLFADAKRGLPPGGSGECAAPRLLQYAYEHGLKPLELAEFWYGQSPQRMHRIHGQFYPSCIEKCSPILAYMAPIADDKKNLQPLSSPGIDPLRILYEDERLLVVFKPKGLLSVPAKDLAAPCLEVLLHQRYPEVKGPMLAHRLDQATSGVMIAAKDAATHKDLQQQFEAKTIHKRYVATLSHRLRSTCGIISLPLTVNPDDRPRQVVDWQYGKAAISYYEVIGQSEDHTQIALYPLTGRTHQLRVHCASRYGLDNPIMGDQLYDFESDTAMDCLQLQAESITFVHPGTRDEMTIELSHSSNVTGRPSDVKPATLM